MHVRYRYFKVGLYLHLYTNTLLQVHKCAFLRLDEFQKLTSSPGKPSASLYLNPCHVSVPTTSRSYRTSAASLKYFLILWFRPLSLSLFLTYSTLLDPVSRFAIVRLNPPLRSFFTVELSRSHVAFRLSNRCHHADYSSLLVELYRLFRTFRYALNTFIYCNTEDLFQCVS